MRQRTALLLALGLVISACTGGDEAALVDPDAGEAGEAGDGATAAEGGQRLGADDEAVDEVADVDGSQSTDGESTDGDDPDEEGGAPEPTAPTEPADQDAASGNPLVLTAEDLGAGWETYFTEDSTLDPQDTTFPDCDTDPADEPLDGTIAFFENETIGNFTQFVFESDPETISQWLGVINRTVDCGEVTENEAISRYTSEPYSFDSGADDVVSVRVVELDAGGAPASGALLMFARYGNHMFIGVTTFGTTVELDSDWIAERHRMAAEKGGLL